MDKKVTVIEPSRETKQNRNDPIHVKFTVKRIDSIVVPADTITKHMKFKVHAMLFNLSNGSLFGSPWVSELVSPTQNEDSFSLVLNEAVYFYTKVVPSEFVMVVEVAKVNTGANESIICGWSCVNFEVVPEKVSEQEAKLYYGSARSLVSLLKNFPNGLKEIPSNVLTYSIVSHPKLAEIEHLVTENTLIGKRTAVHGIEKQSGVSDFMANPVLLQPISLFLDKFEIKFNKNLGYIREEVSEKAVNDFISEVLDYEDMRHFKAFVDSLLTGEEESFKLASFGSITDWKLKVFVHNGFKMVKDDAQIVVLKSQGKGKLEVLKHDELVEVANVLDQKKSIIVFQLFAVVKLSDELYDKKQEEMERLGVGMKDKKTERIVYVKEWKMVENLNNEGQKDIVSDLEPEIDGFKFLLQSSIKSNLKFINSLSRKTRMKESAKQQEKDNNDLEVADEVDYEYDYSESYSVPNRINDRDRQPHTEFEETEVPIIRTVSQQPAGGAFDQTKDSINFREDEMTVISTPRVPSRQQTHGYDSVPSAARSVHGGTQDIREIPYATPTAPVIALSGLLQKKPLQLSRKSYAEIVSAGFPQAKDDFGNLPAIVGTDEIVKCNLGLEKNDPLVCNEIIIQFLAFSKSTVDVNSKHIDTLFFTFQFYKFPLTVTQRLKLTEKSNSLSDETFRPFIFQKISQNDEISTEAPGCMYKFTLDPSVMNSGEVESIVRYLAAQKLIIDVWNGDSLMPLGSCAVELKYLLRQGKPATQTNFEFEVTQPEYRDENSGGTMIGDLKNSGSLIRSVSNHKSVKSGNLHLRMTNIGHSRSTQKTLSQSGTYDKAHTWSKSGSIARDCNTNSWSSTKKQAARLPEVDRTLNSLISSEKENMRLSLKSLPEDRDRKLLRMKQIRSSIMANDSSSLTNSKLSKMESLTIQRFEKEEKLKELQLIDEYRSATKETLIQSMLLSDITANHTIFASFGVAELVEFQFRNPMNEDQYFYVHLDNPNLALLTDNKELRLLKSLKGSTTPISDIFIDDKPSDKDPNFDSSVTRVFLKAHELVYIPLKYTSMYADSSMSILSPMLGSPSENNLHENQPEESSAKVCIKDKKEKPISILALNIVNQPILVDQTFRFNHPEKSVFKRSIRLPPLSSNKAPSTFSGGLNVLCSDMNTICSVSKTKAANEPQDVFIKATTGPSPSVKKFYVSVYEGEFKMIPTQTWLFYIESLKKCDLQCTAGQASRFSLVVKGSGVSRLVKVFVSDPAEMEVEPSEPFILSSVNLVEIDLLIRLFKAGNKQLFVNVVDVDYHQKIHSWLINTTCNLPQITKAFEIKLPVGGGKGSTKKIPFTNNYPIRKRFHVHTDRADLLNVGENEMVLDSGEQRMIGLNFVPVGQKGATEILLFINDDESNNEDTFCIKATYL